MKKLQKSCKLLQNSIDKTQQLCYYNFATKMQQDATRKKEVIFIGQKRKLIFDCFSETEECAICEKKKKTCYGICKKCLIKSATAKLCIGYLAHQTKLAEKHYNYDYENELREIYFKKYHKEFNLNQKNSGQFLKEYCLCDEMSLAKYIRNGGR